MNEYTTRAARGPQSGIELSAAQFTPPRFWELADTRGDDECWPWHGPRKRDGYGSYSEGGVGARAHRVAYALTHGTVPAGMTVRHSCDNPPCVNPAHLSVGSQAENVSDRTGRGRHVAAVGERNGNAILSASDVSQIRAAYARGESQVSLGSRWGVHRTVIGRIVRNQTWRHEPSAPWVTARNGEVWVIREVDHDEDTLYVSEHGMFRPIDLLNPFAGDMTTGDPRITAGRRIYPDAS